MLVTILLMIVLLIVAPLHIGYLVRSLQRDKRIIEQINKEGR